MSASGILLLSGDKGYAVYDQDFKCLCVIQSDCIQNGQVYFAERKNEQFNFLFGDDDSKKVFTTTQIIPRQFEFTKDIREHLKYHVQRFEASQSQKYIFAESQLAIGIFSREKDQPIYSYLKQQDEKFLNETQAQFISDKLLVFKTNKFVIGVDLVNEKELFR